MLDNSRAADADIDHCIAFGNAVECACHERVVIWSIAEDNKLCASQRVAVCGSLCSLFDNLAH